MSRIIKNAKAVDAYYNQYYIAEHKGYLTAKRTETEASALVKWFRKIPTAVCDVGCGDGRHLLAFRTLGATRGFGFDRSYGLVQRAKKNLSMDKNFIVRQMRFSQWRPGTKGFDITYALFSSLSYCLNKTSAQQLITKMVNATTRGGLICIDVDNLARLKKFLAGKLKKKMPVDENLNFDEKKNILSARERRKNVALETSARYFTAPELSAMFTWAGIKKANIILKGGFNNEPFSSKSSRLIVLARK